MNDRCADCGLWNASKTDCCPECGEVTDLRIEGVCLSWKCRSCDYAIVTTSNKLCFWDNGKFSNECYTKSQDCPYFEVSK